MKPFHKPENLLVWVQSAQLYKKSTSQIHEETGDPANSFPLPNHAGKQFPKKHYPKFYVLPSHNQ